MEFEQLMNLDDLQAKRNGRGNDVHLLRNQWYNGVFYDNTGKEHKPVIFHPEEAYYYPQDSTLPEIFLYLGLSDEGPHSHLDIDRRFLIVDK